LANHDDLHITLTLLIGVGVACGVLYWSGRHAAPPPLVFASPPASLPRPPAAVLLPKPAIAQPVERTSERLPPNSQAQETSAGNFDAPELPVVFAFSERSVYTTEEDAEGKMANVSKHVKEGIISNSSDKPLTITATEVDVATQEASQTQFVLSAGMQKHFGSDQGLKMISGDQITLRSPAYRESVQQIP